MNIFNVRCTYVVAQNQAFSLLSLSATNRQRCTECSQIQVLLSGAQSKYILQQ